MSNGSRTPTRPALDFSERLRLTVGTKSSAVTPSERCCRTSSSSSENRTRPFLGVLGERVETRSRAAALRCIGSARTRRLLEPSSATWGTGSFFEARQMDLATRQAGRLAEEFRDLANCPAFRITKANQRFLCGLLRLHNYFVIAKAIPIAIDRYRVLGSDGRPVASSIRRAFNELPCLLRDGQPAKA
jgi:hypothetical protein